MKIVSAAIRYTLRNATNNKMYERVFMCVRYNDRFIKEAIKQFKRDRLFVYKEERGFITSEGEFVLPIEAKEIAVKAGQYPNYALMKRKGLELIEEMREKDMLDAISEVEDRNKELGQLMERKYLLPEDLY